MACTSTQLINNTPSSSKLHSFPSCHHHLLSQVKFGAVKSLNKVSNNNGNGKRMFNVVVVVKASQLKGNVTDEDGVQLGTMKLPYRTDLQRFEALLFQWANSLCQGANMPLPVPLKVDKIPGGARLGFIEIEAGGTTKVPVYIDCLVFPAMDGFTPIFRAIRKGETKNKVAPGEQRIMESLLAALKMCVEISAT